MPFHMAIRRSLCAAVAWLWLLAPGPIGAAESPPAVAVLGFELIDEHPVPEQAEDLQRRLAAIDRQFQQGLHRLGLYQIVPIDPAQDLLDKLRKENAFVYRCNACFSELGQRLGVRLVAVGWVQRVSNLILNVNVALIDAGTGKEILSKSVDMRGNTDESWKRAVAFMLRDWSERRARDPQYGR